MADPFGVSFLPGGDAQYKRPQGTSAPLQEAIKVLSLRVPRVVGANPLAPLALLTGQGGGGMPSGIVETLLRALTPPESAPPVAAIPGPMTPQAPAPTLAGPMVPQPAVPSMLGAPAPSSAPAAPLLPAVRPQVSGAPSAMRAMAPPPMAAMASLPPPSITIGAREPEMTAPPPPATTYAPPSEDLVNREGPERSLAELLWSLGRRQRQA